MWEVGHDGQAVMGQRVDSSCMNLGSPCVSVMWEVGHDWSKCAQFSNSGFSPGTSTTKGLMC